MAANDGPPPGLGQLFVAFAPARMGGQSFSDRLEEMLKEMLSEEGVRLPGDRRQAAWTRAERDGVAVPSALIEKLKAYAGR
jgi:(2R)-3-sulfolactate dehydrogenase (NADP+)